jgi:hypothetical protein
MGTQSDLIQKFKQDNIPVITIFNIVHEDFDRIFLGTDLLSFFHQQIFDQQEANRQIEELLWNPASI